MDGYVNLAGSVPLVGYSCSGVCRGLVTYCRRSQPGRVDDIAAEELKFDVCCYVTSGAWVLSDDARGWWGDAGAGCGWFGRLVLPLSGPILDGSA